MSNMSTSGAAGIVARPIDHEHLARFTLGNRPLELEVLQLFAGQAPVTLADLAAAANDKAWHVSAHTLKGSARAVGAWALARAAEEAERFGPADARRTEMLARIGALVEEARTYIDGLQRAA